MMADRWLSLDFRMSLCYDKAIKLQKSKERKEDEKE